MSLNQPLLLSSALVHQVLLTPATYPSKHLTPSNCSPISESHRYTPKFRAIRESLIENTPTSAYDSGGSNPAQD
jgi:hypothetical protein